MSVDDEEAGEKAKNGSHESQAPRWDFSAAWNWAEEQKFHWGKKDVTMFSPIYCTFPDVSACCGNLPKVDFYIFSTSDGSASPIEGKNGWAGRTDAEDRHHERMSRFLHEIFLAGNERSSLMIKSDNVLRDLFTLYCYDHRYWPSCFRLFRKL